MKSFHTALVLLLCCGFLSTPTMAQEALRCSSNTSYLPGAKVTRAETEHYVRYEFSYSRADHFWNGVIFEFRTMDDNHPLLEGIGASDTGDILSQKLAGNLQRLMVDSMIYQTVSATRQHKLDQRAITTFTATFDGNNDLYAVYGNWNRGHLQFFRTHATSNGEGTEDVKSGAAAQSLGQIIKSCRYHEA